MGVIRQTEEKEELPALWRNVCMRERIGHMEKQETETENRNGNATSSLL